ncbi:LamG-like jellyroll fold domain-containing protein [Hymenobacter sp. AT01-02]|uniref:LamG-like jellyroll fold domain-containing protein n=1 Tax=Hymenobacter sp. AT01-02 TaxID=1571877 RepID=UPI0005F122B2|nr:LamG-like jellyroll fold domain-containing protein [Hymenobacter sp. AT01-02]
MATLIATRIDPALRNGPVENVFYVSQHGALGGANFLTGAVPTTDDTAKLQALCSRNGPKHIVIDRVCPTSAPLKLNSDTTLECINGGAIVLKPGSNCNVLEDATYSTTTGLYTTRNLALINLRVNGNGFANGAFQQIHHRPDGWNVILRLTGVENVMLVNPWFRNARTFCCFMNNFHAVRVMGAFINQPREAPYGNLDGMKFCGPYSDLRVVGVRGYAKDDIISTVGCDIWVPTAAQLPAGGNETNTGVDPRATYGTATNGYISNVVFEDTAMCIRVMSKNSLVDNHTFENISGSTQGGVFLIDNFTIGGATPNFLYDPAPGDGGGNLSTLTFKNVNVTGLVGQNGLGFFALGGRIRDLEFIDCHFLDTSSGEPFIRVHTGAQINNLRAQVKAFSGSNSIVDVVRSSGQITNLFLNAISYERSAQANNSAIFRQEAGATSRIITTGLFSRRTGAHLAWSGGGIGLVHSTGASGTEMLSAGGTTHGHIDLGGKTLTAATLSGFSPDLSTHHNGSITFTRGDAFTSTVTTPPPTTPTPPPPGEGDAVTSYPKTNLTAFWEFNEVDGAFLSSVGSHPLARVNGVTTTTGKQGTAAAFNAAATQRLTGEADPFSANTAMTIYGWAKITNTSQTQVLVSKWVEGNTAQQEYVCYYDHTAAKLKFNARTTSGVLEAASAIPAFDTWFFFAMRWNSNRIYLTINAAFPSTQGVISEAATGAITATSAILTLGGYSESATTTFSGLLDEVGFAQRAYIENELIYLYNQGAGRAFPTP